MFDGASGADGLIVEVHPDPAAALSDGAQSLKPKRFKELVMQVRAIAEAVDRTLELEAHKAKSPAGVESVS